MSWSLATLNLNGLRSATRKGFRDWLGSGSPDVLCLQELRIQRGEIDAAHAPPAGTTAVQADAEKKGYAGSAVWSRLPVLAAQVGGGHPAFDAEGRLVRVETPRAVVWSIYFPSGSAGEHRQAVKDAFLPWVQGLLAADLRSGAPVAVCGDVNIAHTELDIHDPRGNKNNSGFLPHERAWMSGFLADGWVDLWRAAHPGARGYSWWSQRGAARANDKGWRLDYIFASPALADTLESCDIVGRDPALSDHCPVVARFR